MTPSVEVADFKPVFEGTPGLYLILAPDLTIIAVNDAYCTATMTKRDEIIGRGLFEVFPDNPDDPQATGVSNLRSSLERVLKFRRPDTMAIQKYDIRRPDSEGGGFEERYWSPLNSPVLDADGNVSCIIHRVEDVTQIVRLQAEGQARDDLAREQQNLIEQLRRTNEELARQIEQNKRLETERSTASGAHRASEDRFRSIFSAVSEGIFIVDADTGKFTEVNGPGAAMYGFTQDEMIGLDIESISSNVPPYTQKDALVWIEKAAATGQVQHFDWHTKRKDGQLIWVEVSIKFAFLSGRHCVLCIVRDVTERRSMEAQLRQALKMEAIGTLAGGVAHELNNLLQPIIMMTELVVTDLPGESKHADQLNRVIDAGAKAAEIVQRILAFGRADEASHNLLELGFVAREAISFIRTILPSSIKLEVDIDDSVGMVRGDKTQLTQVLINLATNARDAIGADVGKVWVSLSKTNVGNGSVGNAIATLPPGQYAVLAVRDSGAGMDETTVHRIFEPFFTTKGVGKGTGLGLSVTHGIIARHGGSIQVESAPGCGATFLIYLPIAAADLPLALTG